MFTQDLLSRNVPFAFRSNPATPRSDHQRILLQPLSRIGKLNLKSLSEAFTRASSEAPSPSEFFVGLKTKIATSSSSRPTADIVANFILQTNSRNGTIQSKITPTVQASRELSLPQIHTNHLSLTAHDELSVGVGEGSPELVAGSLTENLGLAQLFVFLARLD